MINIVSAYRIWGEAEKASLCSSSPQKRWKVSLDGFEDSAHHVAALLTKPGFFSAKDYVELSDEQTGKSYWLEKRDFAQKFQAIQDIPSITPSIVQAALARPVPEPIPILNIGVAAPPPEEIKLISLDALRERIRQCGAVMENGKEIETSKAQSLFEEQFSDAKLDAILKRAATEKRDMKSRGISFYQGQFISGKENELSRSLFISSPGGDNAKIRSYLLLTHVKAENGEKWKDKLIGEGGSGKAKYAIDLETGNILVVKVYKNAPHRLLGEPRKMEQFIGVEGFVQIYDHYYKNPKSYQFMEFCNGGNLLDCIHDMLEKKRERLSLKQLLDLAKDIAAGLANMHAKNWTYRDLKEENIFLIWDPERKGYRAKIGDFGQPKDEASGCFTGDGTYSVWSPELCRAGLEANRQQVDFKKDDVWSFGLVLHAIFQSNGLFAQQEKKGETQRQFMQRTAGIRELAFSKVKPPQIQALLKRILQNDPTQRPTMEEIVAELDSYEF
jgi:hypothetical protein